MSIMAVMMALGIGGLLAGRDQATLDKNVEELVTAIREVQNKTVSIESEYNGNNVKAWGIGIEPTRFRNKIFIVSSNNTSVLRQSGLPYTNFDNGVTVATRINGNAVTAPTVVYTTPFGNSYVINDNNACSCDAATCGSCRWNESTRPTKDWVVTPSNYSGMLSVGNNVSQNLEIIMTFKGQSRTIFVRGNGDVYAN